MKSLYKKWPRLCWGLLIAILVVGIYGQTTQYYWSGLDDEVHVAENPFIVKQEAYSLSRLWKAPYENLYIPLTFTVWHYMARAAFNKIDDEGLIVLNPHWFHSANLVMHLVNALLMMILLGRFVSAPAAAGIGAVLFAIHPMQVEAVAWISGMKDLLSGVFCLTALLCWDCSQREASTALRRRLLWGLTIPLAALAMLAKPSAAALPIAAWLMLVMLRGRPIIISALSVLPSVLMALGITAITMGEQSAQIIPGLAPWYMRPLIALDSLGFYLWKMSIPWPLYCEYGRTPGSVIASGAVWWTLVLPIVCGLLVYRYRRHRMLAPSAAIALAWLTPVLGLIPFIYQAISTVADRYMYMSLGAFGLAAGSLITSIPRRVIAIAISALLILTLSTLSFFQARTWQDGEKLFRHALTWNPNSWLSWHSLGAVLAKRWQTDEALEMFQRALAIRPYFPDSRYNLAIMLQRKERYAEAAEQYAEALKFGSDPHNTLNNMAIALMTIKRYPEAADALKRSLEFNPNSAETWFHVANLYGQQGMREQQINALRTSLKLRPINPVGWGAFGDALMQAGRMGDAEVAYSEGLRFSPNFPALHVNLALALISRKDYTNAEKELRRGLELQPRMVEARVNLGRLLAETGRKEEAIAELMEAERLDPGAADIKDLLERLRKETGPR